MNTSNWGPETWGDMVAPVYDEWFGRQSPEAAVDFLASLAGTGTALELGIGTGRVALPLAQRGVEVQGIDASEAMVAVLRSKPGGAALGVTVGDFADLPVAGTFDLVFVVANTFFGLRTQDEQIRCFGAVAERLAKGGAFVLEAFVPDPALLAAGSRVSPRFVEAVGPIGLDLTTCDLERQHVDFCHVRLADGGVETYPGYLRYAWPAELDLMARLAGLSLVERYGDWDRKSFSAASRKHVSVYRAPGG